MRTKVRARTRIRVYTVLVLKSLGEAISCPNKKILKGEAGALGSEGCTVMLEHQREIPERLRGKYLFFWYCPTGPLPYIYWDKDLNTWVRCKHDVWDFWFKNAPRVLK